MTGPHFNGADVLGVPMTTIIDQRRREIANTRAPDSNKGSNEWRSGREHSPVGVRARWVAWLVTRYGAVGVSRDSFDPPVRLAVFAALHDPGASDDTPGRPGFYHERRDVPLKDLVPDELAELARQQSREFNARRKSAGLCRNCGVPSGASCRCAKCSKRNREYSNRAEAKRKEASRG